MDVGIKKLQARAITPHRATDGSVGYDVYALIDTPSKIINIMPHEREKIGLGFALNIPLGIAGFLFPRSGLSDKKGLRPSNCVGVIDNDYRGEVIVSLRNDTDEIMGVKDGERIAQLIFMPYFAVDFFEDNKMEETERGSGGFGSTGI